MDQVRLSPIFFDQGVHKAEGRLNLSFFSDDLNYTKFFRSSDLIIGHTVENAAVLRQVIPQDTILDSED